MNLPVPVSPALCEPHNSIAARSSREESGQSSGKSDDCFRLVSIFSFRQKIEFLFGSAVWLGALIFFWSWWFDPAHVISLTGFCSVSLVLAWLTLLPLYFLLVFHGARKPAGELTLPEGSRIAMVVTKAPSEPFTVVAETLTAMLGQSVEHDTWLADEDPSPATLAWCAARGVHVSTRRGRSDYHQTTWPRRTRCKEGNLAFFYDHFGYERYDFVSQLDADQVPRETYLWEILRPFADPGVGYVSAPSICDRNAAASWSARSRLFVEAALHGSLQAGYNNGWAPLCIGSHYAVRTAALKQIGGLGPELAEDHSTTLMMAASGWRGVHALDAIAHGEGPRTFADLATQEFQWSRSLVTILLRYSPCYLSQLSPRLKFQFLFSQFWYPLFSIFMAVMFAMPIVALVFGQNFVNVTYPAFLLHFAPLSIALIVMARRWRSWGSYRPANAKVLSWEGTLFLFARWPWSLAGTLFAVRDWLTGTFVEFRVTPKGSKLAGPLPIRVIAPYALLSFVSSVSALMLDEVGRARGFYIFAIVNSAIYAALLMVIAIAHMRENDILPGLHSKFAVAPAMLAAYLFSISVSATAEHGMPSLAALSWGAGRLSLFQTINGVSGAGQNGAVVKILRFRPRWISQGTLKDQG